MTYSQIIVNRIATLCKKRSISYNKLANMSGLNQSTIDNIKSTIDNIMRGITKDPRISTLHHVALAFGMTLAEFLNFSEINDYSFTDKPAKNRFHSAPLSSACQKGATK